MGSLAPLRTGSRSSSLSAWTHRANLLTLFSHSFTRTAVSFALTTGTPHCCRLLHPHAFSLGFPDLFPGRRRSPPQFWTAPRFTAPRRNTATHLLFALTRRLWIALCVITTASTGFPPLPHSPLATHELSSWDWFPLDNAPHSQTHALTGTDQVLLLHTAPPTVASASAPGHLKPLLWTSPRTHRLLIALAQVRPSLALPSRVASLPGPAVHAALCAALLCIWDTVFAPTPQFSASLAAHPACVPRAQRSLDASDNS